jgi:glycosyltransferase involved in cell wall biosynthesis
LRATLIHHSFRELGGAESVAIATLKVLHKLGFKIDLITIQKPQAHMLNNILGADLIVDSIRSIFPSQIDYNRSIYFGTIAQLMTMLPNLDLNADLVVNTHADIPLPYFTLYGTPLISYIHFPHIIHIHSIKEYPERYQRSILWKLYFAPYCLTVSRMLHCLACYTATKSILLTNSEFSKNTIKTLFPKANPVVVRPPVNTQTFNKALVSSHREDRVLVVGRITPEKSLENAVKLCRLLPQRIKMLIVGTFVTSKRSLHYFQKLEEMISRYKLNERVEVKINISRKELVDYMATSKVYFHPMRGEHFGIAIVEAMSAGLIPVVPDYGGQTEFVPKQYQYHELTDAVRIIEKYFDAPQSERLKISEMTCQFSEDKFESKMKSIIEHVLEHS